MEKYFQQNNPGNETYWYYCQQHQIPHIEISSKGLEYVMVSYDLLPCLPFHELEEDVLDRITKIYQAYADFFTIPNEEFLLAGGSLAAGGVVKKEHSEFIATQLFDYLSDFVAKHRKSKGTDI